MGFRIAGAGLSGRVAFPRNGKRVNGKRVLTTRRNCYRHVLEVHTLSARRSRAVSKARARKTQTARPSTLVLCVQELLCFADRLVLTQTLLVLKPSKEFCILKSVTVRANRMQNTVAPPRFCCHKSRVQLVLKPSKELSPVSPAPSLVCFLLQKSRIMCLIN